MLGDATLIANLGSGDIERTIAFYAGKLGLEVVERRELMPGRPEVVLGSGGARICFEGGGTPEPGPNALVGWHVESIEAAMDALREQGIVFEEYDLPGLKTENGVVRIGGYEAAWFKDPDGNVLSLLSGRA